MAKMHVGMLLAVGLFFACATARADSWIPCTDGRVGGCFLNSTGYMFGCTPQPAAPPASLRAEKELVYVPTRNPRQDEVSQQTQRENSDLRSQLDEARSREMERSNAEVDGQLRAIVDAELRRRRAERDASLAWLATPEGQAQLAATNRVADAQREAKTAQMNA